MGLQERVERYTREQECFTKHAGVAAIAALGAGSGTKRQQRYIQERIGWDEDAAIPSVGLTDDNALTYYQSGIAVLGSGGSAASMAHYGIPEDYRIAGIQVPESLDEFGIAITGAITAIQSIRFGHTVNTGEPNINWGPFGLVQLAGLHALEQVGTAAKYAYDQLPVEQRARTAIMMNRIGSGLDNAVEQVERSLSGATDTVHETNGYLDEYLQRARSGELPELPTETQDNPLSSLYNRGRQRLYQMLVRARRGVTDLFYETQTDSTADTNGVFPDNDSTSRVEKGLEEQ